MYVYVDAYMVKMTGRSLTKCQKGKKMIQVTLDMAHLLVLVRLIWEIIDCWLYVRNCWYTGIFPQNHM